MEILSYALRGVNLAINVILLCYFIASCFAWLKIKSMVYIYGLILSVLFGFADFYTLPFYSYVQFVFKGFSRAAAYVLFSLLMLDSTTTSKWCGSLTLILGVVYGILSFFASPRGAVPVPLFDPNPIFEPSIHFIGNGVEKKMNMRTFQSSSTPTAQAEVHQTGEV